MKLNSDLLNRYIDSELSREEMRDVEVMIKNSDEDLKELNMLQKTDSALKNLKVMEVKSNFTTIVMNKIQRSLRSRQEQKNFIVGIVSIFLVMCLAIAGYVSFEIIRNFNPGTSYAIKESVQYISSATEFISKIINSRNISIVGGVFSFGLVISAWFFFDYSKILRKAGK